MDEEVQHNVSNAMEILEQDLSPRDSKTVLKTPSQADNLSDKATEPPMNSGDSVGILPVESPGTSSKTKSLIKRSRKTTPSGVLLRERSPHPSYSTNITLVLRNSLSRESKTLAIEKIRNAIKDMKRAQYNLIAKKPRKRKSYVFQRVHREKSEARGKKNLQSERFKKVLERVLRLSPVSSRRSVSRSGVSSKRSTESCGSACSHSRGGSASFYGSESSAAQNN